MSNGIYLGFDSDKGGAGSNQKGPSLDALPAGSGTNETPALILCRK